jgi:hypothetical protein
MKKILEFSHKRRIDNSLLWSKEINQFYHPSGNFSNASFKYVYSFDLINNTKFDPVLLKEWFFLIEKNGYLTVDYKPSYANGRQLFEEMLWWLFKDKFKIIFHDDIELNDLSLTDDKLINYIVEKDHSKNKKKFKESSNWTRLIIKKKDELVHSMGDINKWTFGVITNGSRPDYVTRLIESIRDQEIDEYEILICGSYNGDLGTDTELIKFGDRDEHGWITRKKNLIIKKATYDNLMIVHDRMFLKSNWYEGMKEWGNSFEVLSIPQTHYGTKERLAVWQHYHYSKNNIYKWNVPLAHMDYRDWGRYMLDCGAVVLGKKEILENLLFDETLYWGDFEDCILSNKLVELGHIFRLNPYAEVYSITNSLVSFVRRHHKYDNHRLGKLITKPIAVYYIYWLLDAIHIFRNNKFLSILTSRMIKKLKSRDGILTHQDE